MVRRGHASGLDYVSRKWDQNLEENLYAAYVSSALRLMYSKIAKAAMHENRGTPNPPSAPRPSFPRHSTPTKWSTFFTHLELVLRLGLGPLRNVSRPAAVVYIFSFPLLQWSPFFGVARFCDMVENSGIRIICKTTLRKIRELDRHGITRPANSGIRIIGTGNFGNPINRERCSHANT